MSNIALDLRECVLMRTQQNPLAPILREPK